VSVGGISSGGSFGNGFWRSSREIFYQGCMEAGLIIVGHVGERKGGWGMSGGTGIRRRDFFEVIFGCRRV